MTFGCREGSQSSRPGSSFGGLAASTSQFKPRQRVINYREVQEPFEIKRGAPSRAKMFETKTCPVIDRHVGKSMADETVSVLAQRGDDNNMEMKQMIVSSSSASRTDPSGTAN